MLSAGRYLLGAIDLALIVGFACLGAAAVRRRVVPELDGITAGLATTVLALAGLLWTAELLGSFGWLMVWPYSLTVIAIGAGIRLGLGGPKGGPSDAAASRFSHRPLSESPPLKGE
ncbi:MAG TPA: hypothetical protein VG816_10035, partial [Solirubrobacterales bacterium]|nr:hypothetical protein [Solirubrobacterales bacterium]